MNVNRTTCAAEIHPPMGMWIPRWSRWLLAAGMVTVLLGCGAHEMPVRVAFDLRSAHPGDPNVYFYVSDPALVDAAGTVVPVRLDTASPWQNANTALIAFTGESRNREISGRVAAGRYDAFEFMLGVPFERNHGNPLSATPPLNVPSMFWTWQSGYKFLRLDLGNEWSFHLGSVGCISASAVRAPSGACRQPNLARIRLPSKAAQGGTVVVDLDALLAGIDTAAVDNCMDAYADRPACQRLLAALGLDAATGTCVDGCGHQTLFKLDESS